MENGFETIDAFCRYTMRPGDDYVTILPLSGPGIYSDLLCIGLNVKERIYEACVKKHYMGYGGERCQ